MSYTPYGNATPTAAPGKSCTPTSTGSPVGSHSRPAFLKSPTSSRFLVSTLITGSPAARNATAAALTYSNWASRSGCCRPSTTFALACNRYPHTLSSLATVRGPTANPCPVNSSASLCVDLFVHRNGDCGSPRVTGSTRDSNASLTPGAVSVTGARPAPAARTRPPATGPAATSLTPRLTVAGSTPTEAATFVIPPRPSRRTQHQPPLPLVQHRLDLGKDDSDLFQERLTQADIHRKAVPQLRRSCTRSRH